MLKSYWKESDLLPEDSLLERYGKTNVNILRKLFSQIHDVTIYPTETRIFGKVKGGGKFYHDYQNNIDLKYLKNHKNFSNVATLIIKKEVEDE